MPEAPPLVETPGAFVVFNDAELLLLASIWAGFTDAERTPTGMRLGQEVLYEMQRRSLDAADFTVKLAHRAHDAMQAAHLRETSG